LPQHLFLGYVVDLVLVNGLGTARVLRIFSRFRKVSIRCLEHWVLVPVSQLAIHRGIPLLRALVLFDRPFFQILIFGIRHERMLPTNDVNTEEASLVSQKKSIPDRCQKKVFSFTRSSAKFLWGAYSEPARSTTLLVDVPPIALFAEGRLEKSTSCRLRRKHESSLN
jgi:hypothetical protein